MGKCMDDAVGRREAWWLQIQRRPSGVGVNPAGAPLRCLPFVLRVQVEGGEWRIGEGKFHSTNR